MSQQLISLIKDKKQLHEILLKLPKNKIVSLIKQAHKARKEKYPYHRENRYGNLERAFTDTELRTFFKSIKSRNLRIVLLIQLFYALRISELHTIQYDPKKQEIRFKNQKAHDRWDTLPVYGETRKLFEQEWHMPSDGNLRVTFRNTLARAKLGFKYYQTPAGNTLDIFTPHSLRHTGITIFGEHTNGGLKLVKFGRWKEAPREYGSAPTYYKYRTDKMREDLNEAFKPYYDLIQELFIPRRHSKEDNQAVEERKYFRALIKMANKEKKWNEHINTNPIKETIETGYV